MRLLLVFASSLSLFVISEGLLLRYSAFDSRFCCSFNRSKPLAQGWPSFKQWIKWSSLPSVFKFNPQLLNDLIIRFFSSRFQDSKIHSTAKMSWSRFHLTECRDSTLYSMLLFLLLLIVFKEFSNNRDLILGTFSLFGRTVSFLKQNLRLKIDTSFVSLFIRLLLSAQWYLLYLNSYSYFLEMLKYTRALVIGPVFPFVTGT